MTSSIQTVCCCDADNEYVEFLLPPRCTDKSSVGCGCGSSDPYEWRSTSSGCGSKDPRNYECIATGQTDCPAPGSDDCTSCGAVYLEKSAFYNMVLHTCDGLDWSPTHTLVEKMEGWWLSSAFTTLTCTTDAPDSTRITRWQDSKFCGTDNDLNATGATCVSPVLLTTADSRNPLTAGNILSTEQISLSVTRPEEMTAGNISELNVGAGDAWFAIVFRVKSGATSGRKRIFDQGSGNFGLILDGTTLKACLGSEADSAQETSLSTATWHIVVAKREGGVVKARLNGTDFDTNSVSSSDDIDTTSQFFINEAVGSEARFRGQYGDLIVGTGTLSDDPSGTVQGDSVEKLEWYLANKYGLIDSLPGGHPYKTEAPQVTQLTPKEFTTRLASHVFKINLGGSVVPCLLNGGGCLGPAEESIGSDCKTITVNDIKQDCAGNIMFYGPAHPNTSNHYPSPAVSPFPGNWWEWACLYRFWSNTTGCFSVDGDNCPLTCEDDQDPYTDEFNYVSSEWAKGLWEKGCDQCTSCNPEDATGRYITTETQGCLGGITHRPKSSVEWQDPFNALYGLANYTIQNRCSEELTGYPPDDCCGSSGNSNAAFLTSKNSMGPGVVCQYSCLRPDFSTKISYPPFDSCNEHDQLDNLFCSELGPSSLPSPCCVNEGQQLPSTYLVSVGELYLAPDGVGCGVNSTCDCQTIISCGTYPCPDGGANGVLCSGSHGPTGGYCGDTSACNPPVGEPVPEKCDCCNEGDNPPFGCDEPCSEYGYTALGSFQEAGLTRVAPSANVIFKQPVDNTANPDYKAEGLPANNGFLSFTTLTAATVKSAFKPAGCPEPANLDCPEYRFPLDSGIDTISMTCDGDYQVVNVIWVIRRRRGTYSPAAPFSCPGGISVTGTYRKASSNGHDPTGTYVAFGSTPSYAPQTIQVS